MNIFSRHKAGIGLAFGLLLFGYIAREVIEGDSQSFDRRILLSMRHGGDYSPLGPRWLQESARDITGLGGIAELALITTFVACFLVLDGKRRMALFVAGSVASGLLISNLLKEAFHRARPDLVPHGAYVYTSSFPSGHSMLSAVTYLTLGAVLARSQKRRRMKAFFLCIAAFLSLLVGVTRVYLGVHWPTDVVAGWAAGAVWAILCWLCAGWLQVHRTIEREGESSEL